MILETERLILRPWRLSDAEALYKIAKDPEVGPPCGWSAHKSIEESKDILKRILIDNPDEETFAITLKDGGIVIGNISLHKDTIHKAFTELRNELGYYLGKEYFRKGYMSEACKAIMRYGFETNGFEYITVCHFSENIKSMGLIRKLGFNFDAEIPFFRLREDGSYGSLCIYSLKKDAFCY